MEIEALHAVQHKSVFFTPLNPITKFILRSLLRKWKGDYESTKIYFRLIKRKKITEKAENHGTKENVYFYFPFLFIILQKIYK